MNTGITFRKRDVVPQQVQRASFILCRDWETAYNGSRNRWAARKPSMCMVVLRSVSYGSRPGVPVSSDARTHLPDASDEGDSASGFARRWERNRCFL